MTRRLTVARLAVPPEARATYRTLLADLAAAGRPRGLRVWVFRREAGEETFLEFREAPADAAAPSAREAELDARLRALVTYPADAAEGWREVALEP